jgi:hypothetical protein
MLVLGRQVSGCTSDHVAERLHSDASYLTRAPSLFRGNERQRSNATRRPYRSAQPTCVTGRRLDFGRRNVVVARWLSRRSPEPRVRVQVEPAEPACGPPGRPHGERVNDALRQQVGAESETRPRLAMAMPYQKLAATA